MALARVVSFDGVTEERIAELRQRMTSEPRPEDIPASDMILLHDAKAGSALAILVFENEDDYRTADQTLNAMSPDETPGSRASVGKFQVAVRMAGATA
ncbi:MAG TPA: hypothetical protein VFW14_15055 [Gaiellales bacterium]|jgi:hypothetical protein|nr:hypothetical protein [Gaiellales bacterium]